MSMTIVPHVLLVGVSAISKRCNILFVKDVELVLKYSSSTVPFRSNEGIERLSQFIFLFPQTSEEVYVPRAHVFQIPYHSWV